MVARARVAQSTCAFKNKVVSVQPHGNGATLQVETPDGIFDIETDWLIVADGARSPIRRMLNLEIDGKIFMDRFLIADVVMKADFPAERWFWFDPPFHPGNRCCCTAERQRLAHRLPARLGCRPGGRKEAGERHPPHQGHAGRRPRVRAGMGQRLHLPVPAHADFRPGRVLFAGDAAHQVSPFGARGANSGIQDTDNLCWKLKLVIDGKAPGACSTPTAPSAPSPPTKT
jgi:3-(3-hydroxy-phenyl)propionate hydroxylase